MSADTWTPPEPVHVFESDNHRRALGNLGDPRTVEGLLDVLHRDPYTDVWDTGTDADRTALESVLKDLEAAGLATVDGAGTWSMTDRGLEALSGPIPNEPPPMNPILARIQTAEHNAREYAQIADEIARSRAEKRETFAKLDAEAAAQEEEARAKAEEAQAVLAQVQKQMGSIEAELTDVPTPTPPPVIGGDA